MSKKSLYICPSFGDPLDNADRELIRVVYGLASYGAFSYHRLRKEYAGMKVERYSIYTLKTLMRHIFRKLGICSVLELVVMVAKDKTILGTASVVQR